ncbi:hypothetical protein J5N97_011718 [Dioscorea zingiberensis]|uniref:Cytochrome P450 n=1 Tax=Dioscorea zingiberensis TaxID=325984 RepID=A0A9D5HNV9_9LILI|nr:hypothetical protein J5N97_011718 [Dioscorea zingiberensis]
MDSPITLQVYLLLLIIPVLLLLFLNKQRKEAEKQSPKPKLPPGPRKLPLIGNLHQLGNLPHHSLRQLSQQYGPLMYLQLGQAPTIVVSSSEIAREVMRTHDLASCNRPSLFSSTKLSYGCSDVAFISYGDQWRELRKICMVELFGTKNNSYLHSLREEEVARMINSISCSSSDHPIDLSDMLLSMANNIQVINDHLHQSMHSHGQDEDIVHTLLRLKKETGHLTDENIKGILMDIFVAGSDTSSASVEWAMTELMRNQQAMKKAQDEVRKVIGRKGKVEESDLQQFQYLKWVVKETMRLHPPAPLLVDRETMQHFKINGYDIPPKTRVIINAWGIGREDSSWENPQEFNPERFMDSSIDMKGHDFQLIPFGAGRRICPGMNLGIQTVELALANLLYCFDWRLPDGSQDINMDEAPGITVHKKSPLCLVAIKYGGIEA